MLSDRTTRWRWALVGDGAQTGPDETTGLLLGEDLTPIFGDGIVVTHGDIEEISEAVWSDELGKWCCARCVADGAPTGGDLVYQATVTHEWTITGHSPERICRSSGDPEFRFDDSGETERLWCRHCGCRAEVPDVEVF